MVLVRCHGISTSVDAGRKHRDGAGCRSDFVGAVWSNVESKEQGCQRAGEGSVRRMLAILHA